MRAGTAYMRLERYLVHHPEVNINNNIFYLSIN